MPAALVTLCVSTFALALMGAPAFALAPASIEGESYSQVGSASASVSAQIDSQGSATTYFYEYGTTEGYGSTTPPTPVGAIEANVAAPGQLSGLQPDTIYHFRAVAANEAGITDGADVAFSTLAVGIQGLPDGRVYEMVTPPNNYDADVDFPLGQGIRAFPGVGGNVVRPPFQAASGGEAVTYVADPTAGGNGKEAGESGNQYLATRSPQGGWAQVNIQPALYATPAYEAFSSDLSIGILASSDDNLPPLAPEAPGEGYDVLYTRTADGAYHPLFTQTPPNRRPTRPELFSTSPFFDRLRFAGGSADFGHLLFEANDALTPQAEANPPAAKENDLYDSVAGRPYLVNVLPDGTAAPGATFGAPQVLNGEGANFGHVISRDGSRVFWTDLHTRDLYVREHDNQPPSPLNGSGECTVPADACTVQVDASRGPGAGGGGLFWTASVDGSKVYFTDESLLTEDSTAAAGQPDLYEYEVASGALTDLTVDANAGQHADVQGVLGASEDGEYVYFVATDALASGASAGEPNLYVTHGGVITFITVMSAQDLGEGCCGTLPTGVWQQNLADRTSQVAPDGRNLVWWSPVYKEVYRYEVEGSHLVCVSCSPSAEVPSEGASLVVGAAGGYLPLGGKGTNNIAGTTYQPRAISSDGSRVFFLSSAALVPRDVNGLQDVYEWERHGSGTCRESPGCVYLLTAGTSSSASAFLDASASGQDAFLITRSQLLPQDESETFNVFDARVEGVQPPTPAACSGAGCQGIPSAPPIFATPASVTFKGVGNFAPKVAPAAKAKPKPKLKRRHVRKTKRKRKGKRAARPHRFAKTGRSGR